MKELERWPNNWGLVTMTHLLSKYPFITTRLLLLAAVLIETMVTVSATSALAADAAEQQQLVDKAKMTVEAFAA